MRRRSRDLTVVVAVALLEWRSMAIPVRVGPTRRTGGGVAHVAVGRRLRMLERRTGAVALRQRLQEQVALRTRREHVVVRRSTLRGTDAVRTTSGVALGMVGRHFGCDSAPRGRDLRLVKLF